MNSFVTMLRRKHAAPRQVQVARDRVYKRFPHSKHLEHYTMMKLLENAKGKKLLDLGCGNGAYTLDFSKLGVEQVTGVDRCAELITLARKRAAKVKTGVEFIHSDIGSLGEIGDFNFVVANHLLDKAKSFEELCVNLRAAKKI
jgi:ubiquinone/menaquinone biosynthesis C-methylase UbiE